MAASNPEFPSRLTDGEDRAAGVIQRALAEPAIGPSERQSWRKLQHRQARALPRRSVVALACAFSFAVLVAWFVRVNHEPSASLRPDVWSPTGAPTAAASVAGRAAPGTLAPPAAAELAPPAPAKSAGRPQPETSATRCAKFARDGEYDSATRCYDRVARGSGMPAELALYEKARLESKAMGHGALALLTLDEHRRRFPAGVLAAEVGITRIELLTQLGRPSDALTAIDQALQSPLGRERGGDLQVLRSDLLSAQGDCSAALDAARMAQQLGVHPSRLVAAERRCSAAPTTATASASPPSPPSGDQP